MNAGRMPRFEMTIDEVFEIPNRGVVVCGKALVGEIRAGDYLSIHAAGKVLPVRVKFLDAFHNVGPQVRYAGDNVAAGIEGARKEDILLGSRLAGGE
jgi:selenocysteine-specific translation elongation factor